MARDGNGLLRQCQENCTDLAKKVTVLNRLKPAPTRTRIKIAGQIPYLLPLPEPFKGRPRIAHPTFEQLTQQSIYSIKTPPVSYRKAIVQLKAGSRHNLSATIADPQKIPRQAQTSKLKATRIAKAEPDRPRHLIDCQPD